jgi:hypothetical protein
VSDGDNAASNHAARIECDNAYTDIMTPAQRAGVLLEFESTCLAILILSDLGSRRNF